MKGMQAQGRRGYHPEPAGGKNLSFLATRIQQGYEENMKKRLKLFNLSLPRGGQCPVPEQQ
jgi:hypothetical protein